jgi:hypothetical protein
MAAKKSGNRPSNNPQPPEISIATCYENSFCGLLNPNGGKHFTGLITISPGKHFMIAPHKLQLKDEVGFTVEFRAPSDRPLTQREQDVLEAELDTLLKQHRITPTRSEAALAVDAFVESERVRGPLNPTIHQEFNEGAARRLGQQIRGNRFDIEYGITPDQLPEVGRLMEALHGMAAAKSRGRAA